MESGSNFPKKITPKEVQSLLQSDAGKQLIKILNEKDGAVLRNAAEAAKSGQYEKAYEALAPLLKGTDASMLAKKLGELYG